MNGENGKVGEMKEKRMEQRNGRKEAIQTR